MSVVLERYAILERAWALEKAFKHADLREMLGSLSREELFEEPELVFLLAKALSNTGEPRQSLELLRETAEATRWRGNDLLHRLRLNMEGKDLFDLGDTDGAYAVWSELLSAASEARDERRVGWANSNLGMIAHIQGQIAQALLAYERALVASRAVGDRRTLIAIRINQAMAYRELGHYPEALSRVDRAVEMLRPTIDTGLEETAQHERAFVLHRMGQSRLAEALARRAYEMSTRLGFRDLAGEDLRLLGIIAFDTGRLVEAREHFGAALEIARETERQMLEAEVLEETAILEVREGHGAEADAAAAAASRIYASMGAVAWQERVRERVLRERAGIQPPSDRG